jgi:hypothetical protein
MLLAAPLSAATFSAATNTCAGPTSQTSVDAPAATSTGNFTCGTALGTSYGGAGAIASSGGIGVGVEFYSTGLMAIAQATGEVDTTFIVTGPSSDPIQVSINFELSGFLGGGTTDNQVSYRQIENRVTVLSNFSGGALTSQSYGRAMEIWNSALGLSTQFSGDLAPSGTNCLTPCRIQTPTFTVYPGYVNDLELWAQATVESANGFGFGVASFLNTFYFPRTGPVFNLPDGYTVNVEGLNVVNNRVVGPNGGGDGGGSEIPEPATVALTAAGLLAVYLARRT